MEELTCGALECVNNGGGRCCLPGIAVGGPNAGEADQTFCESFSRVRSDKTASASCCGKSVRPAIRCEAEHCGYNSNESCVANSVEICTKQGLGWPEKTECATFRPTDK